LSGCAKNKKVNGGPLLFVLLIKIRRLKSCSFLY
jgi:hypothetical protein